MGQDSGAQAQDALKAALPSEDSVPEVRIATEEFGSIVVRPGGLSEAKTLPSRLGREGSPGQLCVKTGTPGRALSSWDEGLATAQGGSLPGTKTSAREGGPGCSLTLPKARAPSAPYDSVQLAKRHHSQPPVGPARSNHMGSVEMGTLAALLHSGLPKVAAPAELEEEPEKMEMEEPPPAGRKEERESQKVSTAELVGVDLGGKPPTPPLHRFPSWVRGHLGAGRGWQCDQCPQAQPHTEQGRAVLLVVPPGAGSTGPAWSSQPARGRAGIWSDWAEASSLSEASACRVPLTTLVLGGAVCTSSCLASDC